MEPNISKLASVMGHQTRSRMLLALMAGKALTATELASHAEVTPQTATTHLEKLLSAKLVVVHRQGRHKYFLINGPEAAGLVEMLLQLSPQDHGAVSVTGPQDRALRFARTCYDHLAGKMGVALFDGLVNAGFLTISDHEPHLTPRGGAFFHDLNKDLVAKSHAKQRFCRSCLDWSERRFHLAGVLGTWILSDILKKKWANRDLDSRVLRFSAKGFAAFKRCYRLPEDLKWDAMI